MTVNPNAFFALATLLFSMGIVGVVSRKNIIIVYMSIELMLNAVNLILATFSRLRLDEGGSVIALLMIGVIAAEAALFLAIIVQIYRKKRCVDSDAFAELGQGKTL
jgi:NADH-quinone oxidoreductase subunit K